MTYSFEERVIKKTNDLITRYSANLKKFSNTHIYNSWINEGLVKNEFAVGKIGETYGELYLVRTTKTSLKKNKPKVREYSEILKRKKNTNPTIDELANFIGYIVTKCPPETKSSTEPPNKVKKKKEFTNNNRNITKEELEELEEIEEEEEEEKKENDDNDLISLPVVDDWEDL